MKLSLFSNLLLASMMVFAVSCGKDSKKKDGGNYNYASPYSGSGVSSSATATGQTAINNLNSYINGVETITSLVGAINVQSYKYSCSTKNLLGISFLPMTSCSNRTVSTMRYAVPNATRSAQNPTLAGVLTSPSGYTLGNVIQYGSLIVVEHYRSGSTIDTIQYHIMLNRHAVSNPYEIRDTANQSIEQVVYPSI